jgi:hypothetical protein
MHNDGCAVSGSTPAEAAIRAPGPRRPAQRSAGA